MGARDLDAARVWSASTHGHFSLGSMHLALPASQIVEVMLIEGDLQDFPLNAPSIVGMVDFRGHCLPVADIRHLLDESKPALRNFSLVLVVRHGLDYLGLGVDQIHGVFLPQGQTGDQLVWGSTSSKLIVSNLKLPDSKSMVGLLDVEHLLDRSDIPSLRVLKGHREDVVHSDTALDVDPASRPAEVPATEGLLTPHLHYVLARSHEKLYLLDAEPVGRLFPNPQIKPLDGASGYFMGLVEDEFGRLPIIDFSAFCKLDAPRARPNGDCQVLVLKMRTGLVGLLFNEILEVGPLPTPNVFPLPERAAAQCQMINGTLKWEQLKGFRDDDTRFRHMNILRPDVNGLLENEELLELARLSTILAKSAIDRVSRSGLASSLGVDVPTEERGTARSIMTIQLGQCEVSIYLDQVREVIPLPESVDPNHRENRFGRMSLFQHREGCVQVVDLLQNLTGCKAQPSELRSVLLVHHEGGLYGFALAELKAISRPVWIKQASEVANRRVDGSPNHIPVKLLAKLGPLDDNKMIGVIDLHECMATV